MPATKKQIKRLEILDELLSRRRFTLDELLSHLNSRISDGTETINKRTLFRDINYLMEEKNAPIHRPGKWDNCYYYTEKFSLKTLPLDEEDVSYLKKAVEILKQVDDFKMLEEIDAIVHKLENRMYTVDPVVPAVQFERHTASAGQEYFDDLYDAIVSKSPLNIGYQPYLQHHALSRLVHPYLLKEYRNRWFLLGREGGEKRVSVFALDRIRSIRNADAPFVENDLFELETYFNHLIGVSVPYGSTPEKIQIKVFKALAPYIKSKPIHHNQVLVNEYKDGSLRIELDLIINYEFKSTLLSYGAGLQVMGPEAFRIEIRELIQKMHKLYYDDTRITN
jgi:predicted DNA-binding transcriptional regulator YafY